MSSERTMGDVARASRQLAWARQAELDHAVQLRLAIHESGHAVVSLLASGNLSLVRLIAQPAEDDGRINGAAWIAPTGIPRVDALVSLAGPCAEHRWIVTNAQRGHCPPPQQAPCALPGAWQDQQRATACAAQANCPLAELEDFAHDFVCRPIVWGAIVALAEVLHARRQMTGEEVEAVVWQHVPSTWRGMLTREIVNGVPLKDYDGVPIVPSAHAPARRSLPVNRTAAPARSPHGRHPDPQRAALLTARHNTMTAAWVAAGRPDDVGRFVSDYIDRH